MTSLFKQIFSISCCIVSLLCLKSCIEPFSPPEVSLDGQYLVVDGFFNVGATDTSRIELRRTQNVNQADQPVIETGASLIVEGETGSTYKFVEVAAGMYVLPPGAFNRRDNYRIRIQTENGQEYLSEFVSVSVTPTIDSLTYKLDAVQNAMIFYVNAHDEQNKTQFYRWKFDETWEYESTYSSALEIVDSQIVSRRENITKCWGNKKSGSILLGSTVRLSEHIIKNLPLNTIPVSSNKLFRKYSILVKQYGLSREAFEYWTELSKSTQITGGLFDPQPGQVTGNIKNVSDPKNLVFGYFSASTEETKRVTIAPGLGKFPRCTEPDTIPVRCTGFPDDPCAFNTQKLLLTYWGPRSDYVLVASPECADCRTSGGTTRKPSFW